MREYETQCIQEQQPFCQAECPVHVDVRAMLQALAAGNFNQAVLLLAKTVPFPGIISCICDHPCQHECKRREAGGSLQIKLLEQAALRYGSLPVKKTSKMPPKANRIAIVGGGLSGLTAAYDLLHKGYEVAVWEAQDRIGGRLVGYGTDVLPREVVAADFSIFNGLKITFNYQSEVGGPNSRISLAELCIQYDAVYLGIGMNNAENLKLGLRLNSDGRIQVDPVSYATSNPKIFAGGSQRYARIGHSPITSIADGRSAAISIDRFIQQVSLTAQRETEGAFKTKLYTSLDGVLSQGIIQPMESKGYTQGEAIAEAKRCLNCQCLECVKVCDYLAHYGSYPKRYVREIYNNDSIVMGMRQANKMVNSCSLCRLCETVCPNNLNMGEICRQARQSLVVKGKMPPSAHDFALRDLEFNNSEAFALVRHQPGHDSSKYAFFPGCQLSASAPDQVVKIYSDLTDSLPGGVGLMLGCCGVPADWAGRRELFAAALEAMTVNWHKLGDPCLITACPTCYAIFKEYLPAIPLESLWTLLDKLGVACKKRKQSKISVHDPCTTRYEDSFHTSVRSLLAKLGLEIEEHRYSKQLTGCCGYGGLMQQVNQEVADKVAVRLVAEHSGECVTYCAMCRDVLASRGKRTLHVLDYIYADDLDKAATRKGPGYSDRHENRARLKIRLLREMWRENVAERKGLISITVPEDVLAVMEERMILKEDIQEVIHHAEQTGRKLFNPNTNRYTAYYKPVSVTYWVEYSAGNGSFIVHNAYSHRMEIVEE